ncbi:MAG: hypothetical protein AB1455_11750, partial [Pseudomonadota bacterium]
KRPANRPKWPSHSFRRRVWATCFFEILDPGAFDEHFFNGLLMDIGKNRSDLNLHGSRQAYPENRTAVLTFQASGAS